MDTNEFYCDLVSGSSWVGWFYDKQLGGAIYRQPPVPHSAEIVINKSILGGRHGHQGYLGFKDEPRQGEAGQGSADGI